MTTVDKPKRSNLTLRFMTAGVAVPFILWALLLGPKWVWPTFVLGPALAIAGQELFGMVLPEAPGLRIWGIGSTLLMGSGLYFAMARADPSGLWPLLLIAWVLVSMLAALSRPLPSESAGPKVISGLG